ncbi:MAG: TolC family protein, partial [Bacteroidetes bacterium]|nr:TolC family protein [Bacteroidota bacterium]
MKHQITTIAFFLSISSFAISQENAGRKITLDTALDIALKENKTLQISQLEVDKAYSKLTEARGNLMPKINASGQYTRNIEKPVIFLPPGSFGNISGKPTIMEIGSDNSYNASVSASLPIFSYPIYSSISMASTGTDLAQEANKGTKAKTIADVKKNFYQVLLAREAKNLMQASLKNALDNLENVRRMQKQGLVSEYDLIRAEVQVENIKPIALQAENNYELAKNSFKITLGLDAAEQIDVEGELKYVPVDPLNLNTAINEALQQNSDIKQLNFQVELSKEMVHLERSNHLPTLAVFGNYQYQTQANNFKFSDYYWVKTFFAGLQIQVPIFNGWGTQAKVDQAKISYQQAAERQSLITESIKIQTQNALYRIEQAKKRIEGQDRA